jgi:hypothetical protein
MCVGILIGDLNAALWSRGNFNYAFVLYAIAAALIPALLRMTAHDEQAQPSRPNSRFGFSCSVSRSCCSEYGNYNSEEGEFNKRDFCCK